MRKEIIEKIGLLLSLIMITVVFGWLLGITILFFSLEVGLHKFEKVIEK